MKCLAGYLTPSLWYSSLDMCNSSLPQKLCCLTITFTEVLTIEYLYTHSRHGIRAPIPQTRGVLVEEDLPPSELSINNKKHFYYICRADFAF